MTTVKIQKEPAALAGEGGNTCELRLIVAGHAGFGEKGKDIVCAAESILVQSLACALTRLGPEQLQDVTVEGVAGSGCVGITAIPTPQGYERVQGMFESACVGFCLLAEHYPEHVRVVALPPAAAEAGAA